MLRVESNQELLHLPDYSSSRMVTGFNAGENIGGGLIVINHYGDYVISIGPLTTGILGKDWADEDAAIDVLSKLASDYSEKCLATDLSIGGCAIILYFKEDTKENRRKVLQALAKELRNVVNTNVLCLPAEGITYKDVDTLYLESQKLREDSSSDEDEKKRDTASKRSRTLSNASEIFEYPIPMELVKDESAMEKLSLAGVYSAYGALETLAEVRKWRDPSVALVGLTPLSKQLFELLRNKGFEVFISDPSPPEQLDSSFKDRWISWDQVFSYRCDILVPCISTIPRLSPEFIRDKLRCHHIISLSHNLMPNDMESRNATHLHFDENGISDFCDGLLDLGSIAKMYHLSQREKYTPKDAQMLGRKVMSKSLHLAKIVQQYDIDEKYNFYKMANKELDNLSKDKLNLGLGTMIHDSSERMTEWMWSRAKNMCPAYRAMQHSTKNHAYYLDLGSGIGNGARWICKQNEKIYIKCINISPKQNTENRQISDEQGVGGQVSVETVTFERLPVEYSNTFDGCIAQDSFCHAFSRMTAFHEAFKATKGGGWILASDLMCGDGENVGEDELKTFAENNNIKNWVTSKQCVEIAEQAGWVQVQFIDCTPQVKVSLRSLLQTINNMIDSRRQRGFDLKLLQSHRVSLIQRIGQADRGVFKWGIIAARKPYNVVFMSPPPVKPDPKNTLMSYSTNLISGDLKFGTDAIILNISDRMPRDSIMNLPKTVRLIVTMSAGLDHIAMDAAEERGIRVRRAARFQIVKSVADYLLCNIIFGLRNGYQNVGVPFPGKKWNLSWNADGVDLDRAKIGFIGMGAIADECARRIRSLSRECVMVYHIPKGIRSNFEEGTYQMYHVGIADLYSTCNVVIPMVPLTPSTTNLVDYSAFAMMDSKALFINMARGKVVKTDDLLRALKEGIIRHAILDTTEPEPLPEGHELWTLPNCTITPHFATNTTYVREELVEDIPNLVADTLEERGILRLEEQRARKELSDAYRITREFGMDELVWNHLSILLSDGTYLITPGSRMFDDISPQDLVKSGGSGNVTADIIHDAVYKARSDVRAIVHLHTPATVAVSCLEMGFVPLAQEAAPFVGRVASHPWHGVSNDWAEQKQLEDAVRNPKYNTLIMENHGFCTFGKTLGEAWVLAYYFDKACQTQLNCLQTGAKIKYPDPKVLKHASEQAVLPEFLPGACEWEALRKMLTRRSNRR